MFTIKGWKKGFLEIEIKEPHFKDHKKEEVTLYDVSSKEDPHYTSDFMKENNTFDYKQYCICLLRGALELSVNGMREFLKYQCALKDNPTEWLGQFQELLEIADDFKPTEINKIRFKRLSLMIEEQCVELAIAEMKNGNHSMSDPAVPYQVKEKYNMERSKRIVFIGTAIKLADVYIEHFLLKDKKISLKDINQVEEAERAYNLFCKKDGKLFVAETIRTNLGKTIRRILNEKEE